THTPALHYHTHQHYTITHTSTSLSHTHTLALHYHTHTPARHYHTHQHYTITHTHTCEPSVCVHMTVLKAIFSHKNEVLVFTNVKQNKNVILVCIELQWRLCLPIDQCVCE